MFLVVVILGVVGVYIFLKRIEEGWN